MLKKKMLSTTMTSPPSAMASNTSSTSDTNSGGGNPSTDFSDDPFKNYRYEDVFNIEDPFSEESVTIKGEIISMLYFYF